MVRQNENMVKRTAPFRLRPNDSRRIRNRNLNSNRGVINI